MFAERGRIKIEDCFGWQDPLESWQIGGTELERANERHAKSPQKLADCGIGAGKSE